jgi:hypothetical protein
MLTSRWSAWSMWFAQLLMKSNSVSALAKYDNANAPSGNANVVFD